MCKLSEKSTGENVVSTWVLRIAYDLNGRGDRRTVILRLPAVQTDRGHVFSVGRDHVQKIDDAMHALRPAQCVP